MGLFKGIGDAKVLDAVYIKPCDVLVRIDMTKVGENRKKEQFAFVEGTVIHCLSDSEHTVGESITQAIKVTSDYFERDVKAFICSALGVDQNTDPGDIDAAAEQVFESGDNPLQGTVMHLKAIPITTKQGNPFTKISWKGEVTPSRLKELLSPEEIKRFYPDGALDELIANYEAANA